MFYGSGNFTLIKVPLTLAKTVFLGEGTHVKQRGRPEDVLKLCIFQRGQDTSRAHDVPCVTKSAHTKKMTAVWKGL